MGLGNARPDTPAAHRCDKHPDRFAAVQVNGVGQCWQCYLPPRLFALRFGPDYYMEAKICPKPSK